MKISAAVVALLGILAACPAAAAQGDTPFVVTYRCDGGTLSALETNRPLLSNCVAN